MQGRKVNGKRKQVKTQNRVVGCDGLALKTPWYVIVPNMCMQYGNGNFSCFYINCIVIKSKSCATLRR